MRWFHFVSVAAVLCLCSTALAAQQDIDIQMPIGTSLTHGQTVNHGKTSNGDIINYVVRIENVGNADLTLIAPVVDGSSYKSVQVSFTSVPAPQVITAGNWLDFNMQINPDKDSDWSFNMIITSNDPTDPAFSVKIKGTEGKPKKDDEGCSTSESSGTGLLVLLGVLCAAVAAARLRNSRA